MLRAFLYKISSKLKKFKINFEDKASFILKMSKSELIKSASEDENNETEEIETSDDEYLPDFTKLQPCICERVKKSVKENCPGKEILDSEEDSRIGNTLWCSCGKYKPMATHAESVCCLGKYEIHESYFKGIHSFVFEIFLSSNLLVEVKTHLC